jgi:hypothetical protein
MSWVAVGVGAAGLIAGQSNAQKQADAAEAARKQALGQFSGVTVPTIDSQTLALQNYQNTGELTPEMQQQMLLGNTNMEGISTDPRLQAAQMQALQQLSGIASGSPQAGDQAGFELARQNVAGELNAQNNKVLQDMQQRGQAGSGAELLMKLKNNQVGAQQLANQQMEQAKAMQQARMQALQSQANLASGIRGQDYSEQEKLANARDQIAKYNAANAQNVSNTNVGARNLATAQNLQNKQNISNMNTSTQNDQQKFNKGLQQTQFQNQIQKAGGTAAQLNNQATAAQQQAANTAGQWAQFGQGAAQAITAANAKKPATTDDEV